MYEQIRKTLAFTEESTKWTNYRNRFWLPAGQELHTLPGLSSSKLPIPTRTLLPGDTSSDQSLQTLHNWIETCVEHHEICAGRKVNQLPNRVLEIDGEHVYLREHLRNTAMYACLSHCWGQSGPTLKLDKASSRHFFDGILIDRLPKTFADAVNLCTRLGLRFIWIDACCKLPSSIYLYSTKVCSLRHYARR
jgi:hypothetical protein